MKKSIIIFILTILIAVTSCKKSSPDKLNDVFYVRTDHAEMPAYVYGNGLNGVFIVVLHGGPGGTGLEYRPGALKELESYYAVVYFDQRNSGMSSGNYSSEDLTIEQMGKDILALVKVLKFKYGHNNKFVLYGHSWGGTLGTEVLLQDQSPFMAWIESDGAHNIKDIGPYQYALLKQVAGEQIVLGNSERFWNRMLDEINSMDATNLSERDINTLYDFAVKGENNLIYDGILDNPELEKGNYIQSMYQNNKITSTINGLSVYHLLTKNSDLENIDYTPELHKINIPVLFQWGKYDMIVPPVLGQQAYDSIGSTEKEIIIYEKSGHSPLSNQYQRVAVDIKDFIEKYR